MFIVEALLIIIYTFYVYLCTFDVYFVYFGHILLKKIDKNRVSGFLPFLPSSREERYFFRIGNNREKTTVFSL